MLLVQAPEPFFEPDWAVRHSGEIAERLAEHLYLTALAVGIGLVIALPLGVFAYRNRRAYAPITWVTGVFYTIPSLALLAFLVPYTGLSTLTAEIALVGYTLLILIRNTVAGLDAVPADVKEAAVGMGYGRRQLLYRVELPLALPIIFAGIRIAVVSTIGLVTVTALIGKGGLGYFILTGLRRFFSTPIVLGAGLSVALAIVMDRVILAAQRLTTPWARLQA